MKLPFLRRKSPEPIEDPGGIDATVEIPADIAHRLLPHNPREPWWPRYLTYGKGKPGVTQETERDWVVRDPRGIPVGGVTVHWIGDDHPRALEVAIDPRYRRQGYATQLYEALTAAGIDVEASSDKAIEYGTITAMGYAFMVGRRLRLASRGRAVAGGEDKDRTLADQA